MTERTTKRAAFLTLVDALGKLPRGTDIVPTPPPAKSPPEDQARYETNKRMLAAQISYVHEAYTKLCDSGAKDEILDWLNE